MPGLPDKKRILIVRPDRIGDVVLSTALPREIKKKYPDAFVAVLVRDYTKGLFNNNPYVDEVISKDDFNLKGIFNYLGILNKIRKYRFNISLSLLPTAQLSWLTFFAGIQLRIGVGHKFYQFITNAKSVYRRKYIPLRHEADFCLDTIRKIGVKTSNYSAELYLSEEEKQVSAKTKANLLNGKKFLVGIHSGSGKSAPNWTKNSYAELIVKLLEDEEIGVVVTDNERIPEFNKFEGLVYPNDGAELRKAITNFAAVDLLVSASTGPMHIVAGLKGKTVSLFCPLPACSPVLWSAAGNDTENVLPEEDYCQTKCPKDPKVCTLEGEGGISAEKIYKIIKQKLNK